MKDKYNAFCTSNDAIPIFMQPWWLDAVVENDKWDVVLIEEARTLRACFVYVFKSKGPFNAVGMPGLTPFLGFWFDNTVNRREAAEKLLSKLPKHDKFYMQMHYKVFDIDLSNASLNQQALHTYTLSGIKDHDSLYAGFKKRVTGEIKKAQGKIIVKESSDVPQLYALCEKSYKRQGKEPDFSLRLVHNIYDAVIANNCGTILLAEDDDGNAHAATMLVWDSNSAYYLLNGGDPELRSSGANSMLMWHVIKHASQFTDTFDFEGSMIPGVEKYIQGYGAEKKQYSLFTGTSSILVTAAENIKGAFKKKS